VTLILNVKTLEDDEPADAGKKKLVITEEHFQRVTQALVMKLRQHEESVKKDGTNTYLCS
jgi:DNA replication licensing factor MCM6